MIGHTYQQLHQYYSLMVAQGMGDIPITKVEAPDTNTLYCVGFATNLISRCKLNGIALGLGEVNSLSTPLMHRIVCEADGCYRFGDDPTLTLIFNITCKDAQIMLSKLMANE